MIESISLLDNCPFKVVDHLNSFFIAQKKFISCKKHYLVPLDFCHTLNWILFSWIELSWTPSKLFKLFIRRKEKCVFIWLTNKLWDRNVLLFYDEGTSFRGIIFFFSIWVFFHEHWRITGLQGKGEGISLTPHYHFHPLHGHLDIRREITAESSPLHITSSRTRTRSLWFPSTSR